MATHHDPRSYEEAASAAQMRDLSSQVQMMQTQLNALRGRAPAGRLSPHYPFLLTILLLGATCVGLLLFPLRERTVVRYVPQIKVVHEVRVVVATPVPPARPAGGVSVCAEGGFDLAGARCSRPTSQFGLSDLAGARVSYTGKDGGVFTAPQVMIALSQRNSAGSVSLIGRVPVSVLQAGTSQASRLQGVFDALGTIPTAGSSYAIEVDQGNSALGVASFSIVVDNIEQ